MRQLHQAEMPGSPSNLPRCAEHQVAFYERGADLVDSVVGFLRPPGSDGVAVIVATAEHQQALTAALRSEGLDLAAAAGSGQLILLDASGVLVQILDGGAPNPSAFATVIGDVLDQAAASGAPVRVYGEMVAVLWEEGNVAAAMEVEALWNQMLATRSFELLCGYPAALFAHPGSRPQLDAVCEQHSSITMPPSLRRLPAGADPSAVDGRMVRWELPAHLTSGGLARAKLRALLVSWRLVQQLDEAELLVTELVNNAIVHGRSDVTVEISHRHGSLRAAVTDAGGGTLEQLYSGLDDIHGRGLMLVETISSAWGTALHEVGKTVWFELRTDAA